MDKPLARAVKKKKKKKIHQLTVSGIYRIEHIATARH